MSAIGSSRKLGRLLLAAAFLPSLLLFAQIAHGAEGVGVRVYRNGALTSTSGSVTILWDAETRDTLAFHDPSTNTDRLTVPTGLGGWYLYTVTARWQTGNMARSVTLARNYSAIGVAVVTGGNFTATATTAVYLDPGDHVTAQVYTDSNSALTVGAVHTFASLVRIESDTAAPTAGPTGTPGPTASPMTIDAFTGAALEEIQRASYVDGLGWVIAILLLSGILVAAGLRR